MLRIGLFGFRLLRPLLDLEGGHHGIDLPTLIGQGLRLTRIIRLPLVSVLELRQLDLDRLAIHRDLILRVVLDRDLFGLSCLIALLLLFRLLVIRVMIKVATLAQVRQLVASRHLAERLEIKFAVLMGCSILSFFLRSLLRLRILLLVGRRFLRLLCLVHRGCGGLFDDLVHILHAHSPLLSTSSGSAAGSFCTPASFSSSRILSSSAPTLSSSFLRSFWMTFISSLMPSRA